VRSIVSETYFVEVFAALVVLWLLFAAGLFLAERGVAGASLTSYGRALYWGIAAFSTAGIADTPLSALGQAIGGVWIVVGSTLFFGTIVATVTSYFLRPVQRPARRIIETVEFNLEHMQDLTLEELDLLKQTVDMLIEHMEHARSRHETGTRPA
jgi:voltage-gated potassium channel